MFRFHRLAVLISAAGIAAAPGTASERGWRSEAGVSQTAPVARSAAVGGCPAATARSRVAQLAQKSQSLAPQSSQAELRNAAAARMARLWAGRDRA